MSKRLITALLVLLAIGVQAFAQSAVSGRITDEAGEPLVGANVLVKGTTTGTMTDYNGNYSLNEPFWSSPALVTLPRRSA